MDNHKIRLRSYILIVLMITLPILFSFYSPVLLVWGIRNGLIKVSLIVFAACFILSLFMDRSESCGYNAQMEKKSNGELII